MANEITISASLDFSKGGIGSSLSDTSLQFDVTGTDYHQGTMQVGTSAETLNLGDITTPGYCYMKNYDATNYVEVIGVNTETATIKLKAGEVALFRFASAAPEVQANTSIVQIDYLLIED